MGRRAERPRRGRRRAGRRDRPQLGLDDEAIERVATAAELHDIGKIAIPRPILRKTGALDADEREFLRRHTLIGERIVAAAPALGGVAQMIRSSHERWDGRGYPDALAGEEIPLGAQIVFVCDAFSAMTPSARTRARSPRPRRSTSCAATRLAVRPRGG